MLPSLGFNEIIILGILALLVVGPKDLPLLFRKLGRWTAKLRGMAQEFRTGFDDLARQAELDELKREVDSLRRTTSLHDIRTELSKPFGTLEDYAGIKPSLPAVAKPDSAPAITAPVEAPALAPPIAPARGPSGAMVQTDRGADAVQDNADDDAPVEEPAPSNVTPISRSAP
ncbi:MAG: twin-arginine translocase subunit TatB [Alphaproteobacteria bacterium]|nr:MAG: twin-arginine translocase subunit TatB [Alphaproteobacteria bacterium]